jgi:hypothetical protein
VNRAGATLIAERQKRRRYKAPDTLRPFCAVWYAEEWLKTNNPADLNGQNSSEICSPDVTLRFDLWVN